MKMNDFLQVVLFIIILCALAPLLGFYLGKVFQGERHFLSRPLSWLERLVYKLSGIEPGQETSWRPYLKGLLIFNFVGFIVLFILQLLQSGLPLNPQHLPDVTWHSAFNTAVSFMTNTNWQGYAGETTLSYFVQMAGLTVQNFLSAATGIAVLLALIRGLARKQTDRIGNFWVDVTRSTVYLFLPFSILLAIVLTGEGVIQNFSHYAQITTLEGAEQTIPMGPAASQIAIKQLGTNGGGFFNANSAHPYENPTPLTNFLEMLAILLVPAALTFTYGKMIGKIRQGTAIFSAMMILFAGGLAVSLYAEYAGNPMTGSSAMMEGKETRFGVTNSVLWSVATTDASNGSVNAMHDSLSPFTGMIAMINMMVGEVIFGGVGSGLYGMVIFIILTVFIAGLMVGRTPEYLGKKIDAFEVKMSIIGVLLPSAAILLLSALAFASASGLASLNNSGPHGFSEILYAFSSAAGNNGSAFAGLNANTLFYNLTLGAAMLIGRFGVIIPVMAIAGNMATKKVIPPSLGTFRTDNGLFIGLLIAVILIVGGLTFFPALALGPVLDHLLLNQGILF